MTITVTTIVRTVVGTAGTALGAGICLLGATAPAHAATRPVTVRVAIVGDADLDLPDPAGRVTFDRRIVAAAR